MKIKHAMKTSLATILLAGFLTACQPNDPSPTLATTGSRTGWTTIPISAEYTIQYPPDLYMGRAYEKRVQTTDRPALVERNDAQSYVAGPGCNPLVYPCRIIEYGDSLTSTFPNINYFLNPQGRRIQYDQRIHFERDGRRVATLVFGKDLTGTPQPYKGVLYALPKNETYLRYLGRVAFADSTKQEVLDLIGTLAWY